MACSRLSSLPPELKLEIYFYVCHIDLLPLSHVSKYWRSIVLHDGRWNKWFEMIINTQDGKCLGEIMERFKILDVIPKRTIVTLCFNTKCSQCRRNTPFLFLPLLQRVCDRCLYSDQTYNVIGLSSALVIYDLSERDVREMVVLHWEKTDPEKNTKNITKLVSRLAAENVYVLFSLYNLRQHKINRAAHIRGMAIAPRSTHMKNVSTRLDRRKKILLQTWSTAKSRGWRRTSSSSTQARDVSCRRSLSSVNCAT
ncbi:hypothetical protein K438DRAFT_536356 [Mycena galopus ATCC 62051]|nr:hypothetical protein K438DRAFT_536356 [Mycena galopus ATCC 62051]